jgi:hypothetical protein
MRMTLYVPGGCVKAFLSLSSSLLSSVKGGKVGWCRVYSCRAIMRAWLFSSQDGLPPTDTCLCLRIVLPLRSSNFHLLPHSQSFPNRLQDAQTGRISSHLTFLCRHVQHPFLDLGFDCRVPGRRRSPIAESTSEFDPEDCDLEGLDSSIEPVAMSCVGRVGGLEIVL